MWQGAKWDVRCAYVMSSRSSSFQRNDDSSAGDKNKTENGCNLFIRPEM